MLNILILVIFIHNIEANDYTNCSFTGYSSWLTFDNKTCYYVASYSDRVTWHDANEACQLIGSQLLSIHDQQTNRKFAIMTRKLGSGSYYYNDIFWIGLNALSQRGIYRWSDRSTYQYSNWPYNAPQGVPALQTSDYYTQGRCVYFYSMSLWQRGVSQNYGYWYYNDCNDLHSFICAKQFGTTSSPSTTTTTPPENCGSGWFQFDDKKCIKLLDTATTYTAAQRRCVQTFHGDLLGIHSKKEQLYITALIAGKPAPYIGLTKLSYRWSWSDQSNLSYTKWGNQVGHTYNYQATCGVMSTTDVQAGNWIPVECDTPHPAICEKPKDEKVSSQPPNAFSRCSIIGGLNDFIQYRNSCYYISDSPQTWDDAVAQCQLMSGSNLVSILDGFEYSFLMYIVLQYSQLSSHWIGFFSPEILTDALSTIQAFEWIDSWPNYYTQWEETEPKFNVNGSRVCVYQTKLNGTWKTDNCEQTRGFICKKTINKMVEQNFTGGVCPKSNAKHPKQFWVDLDKRSKYCYWFSMDLQDNLGAVAWSDASFHCRQRNGSLASIHSEHELSILKNKISSAGYNTWIGLYQLPEGSYAWDDGSAVDFTNWDMNFDDEDISRGETDSCVEIQAQDLRWHKTKCTGYSGYKYYVCQTPKILGINPTATALPSSDIKSNRLSNMDLSGGAKVAIILSVVCVVGLALIGMIYIIKKYNISTLSSLKSFDNTMYANNKTANGLIDNEPKVTFSKIDDNMTIHKS